MSKIGDMWRRLKMLGRREEIAQELDEEMRLHREMKERGLIATGLEAGEARYAAARAFGNVTASKVRIRDNAEMQSTLGLTEVEGHHAVILSAAKVLSVNRRGQAGTVELSRFPQDDNLLWIAGNVVPQSV